jgi:hypothetical protein
VLLSYSLKGTMSEEGVELLQVGLEQVPDSQPWKKMLHSSEALPSLSLMVAAWHDVPEQKYHA